MKALEAWDRRILAGLVDGLDALGPWRMLLLPDHPTPVELKTHTTDSVPYLLVDSADRRPRRHLHRGRPPPAASTCPATSSWAASSRG